jgi:hypothetical protein
MSLPLNNISMHSKNSMSMNVSNPGIDPRNSARPSFHQRDQFDQILPLNTDRAQPLNALDNDKYIPLYKRNHMRE